MLGQPSVHSFPCCIGCYFIQGVVFDHWPTHSNIRDLRKVFPAMELLSYPRGFVLSRRALNRRRTLLLRRLFALPIGCDNRCRVSGSSNSVQFSWIQNVPAQPVHWCSRIHHKSSFLGFRRRWRWCCPNFWRWVERGLCPFFELVDTFGHLPRDSGSAPLLFQGFFFRSLFKFWSIGATLMRTWKMVNSVWEAQSQERTWWSSDTDVCIVRYAWRSGRKRIEQSSSLFPSRQLKTNSFIR